MSPSSFVRIGLRSLLAVPVVAAGALGFAPGAGAGAVTSHAQSIQFHGVCNAGEAGKGSLDASYQGFATGSYTAGFHLTGQSSSEAFGAAFTVSSTNPSPLVVWPGLAPGSYTLAPTLIGPNGQGNNVASVVVTIPDCLANGNVASITAPIVGMTPTPDNAGYTVVGTDGNVYPFGDAAVTGGALSGAGLYGTVVPAPIVGIATTPDGKGAWQASSNGSVYQSGDALSYGSAAGYNLTHPIVGIAATPDGKGYWLVATDGGIFSFGDARFYGSTGALRLNQPIVGMATDDATGGYWLVAADGGIFSFNAPFLGSTGSIRLNKPIVGMEASADGSGYTFVASDGGIFCFGTANFWGSMGGQPLNQPIVGMASAGPLGYWLVAADGGIFSFGDAAAYYGSPA